jgi:hypothetical protein
MLIRGMPYRAITAFPSCFQVHPELQSILNKSILLVIKIELSFEQHNMLRFLWPRWSSHRDRQDPNRSSPPYFPGLAVVWAASTV